MSDKIVTVEITNRGAVYVDGTRITDRSTKWGIHTILSRHDMLQSEVIEYLRGECVDLRKIDAEPYAASALEVNDE